MRQFAVCMVLLGLAGCSAPPMSNGSANRAQLARDLGPVSRDTVFQFVIGLRLRAPHVLDKVLREQPLTRDFYTPEDFATAFGVSAAEYQRTLNWLRAEGLTILRTNPGRTSITAEGTAEQIERAFHVEMHQFLDDNGEFQAATREPTLAPAVFDVVSGVVGLSGAGGWRSHMVRPPQPRPNAASATDLITMYNASAVVNPGEKQTVAILGAGGPPDPNNDVAGYLSTYQPFNVTTLAPGQYTQVFVGGPNRDPANLANQEYGENVLDINMVLALAPYAKVMHVLTATNSPGLFTDGISYIVNQLPQAHAVSVSYGTCERGAAGSMPVVDILLAQAKAEGQQWFFAAGDSGTDGCRDLNGSIMSAGWPASSPYAIGVGGTELPPFGGTTEQTWSGGGGGVSESYDKPAYQAGIGPSASDGSRDEPDVAALAGNPGVATTGGGAQGTSCAAPMWAAVWALINQAHGGATGISNAHERLYQLGKAGKGFHDITKGSISGPGNGTPGWKAGPGYDLATGWGSPNVASLIANW